MASEREETVHVLDRWDTVTGLLFCFLLNIKDKWTRYVARIGKIINEFKTLLLNLKGNDLFKKPRHRRKCNIQVDVKKEGMNCGLNTPD
jgi:hypothetical protein